MGFYNVLRGARGRSTGCSPGRIHRGGGFCRLSRSSKVEVMGRVFFLEEAAISISYSNPSAPPSPVAWPSLFAGGWSLDIIFSRVPGQRVSEEVLPVGRRQADLGRLCRAGSSVGTRAAGTTFLAARRCGLTGSWAPGWPSGR